MDLMPIVNLSYANIQTRQNDPKALAAIGPQINIDIEPPSAASSWAKASKIALRSASNIMALFDTGASITGIDYQILAQLQYPPIGIGNLATPSGTIQTQMYMVKLVIPSRSNPSFPPNMPRIIIDNVCVISVDLSRQHQKVLLGRDILRRMILVYNGPQALVTLGY